MESSTSYTTLKDGFKIAINKSDTELTVEAEDEGNGNTFSAKFTDGTIKTISLEMFENIPEFFEGLVAGFRGDSQDQSVRVDPNGTIFFRQRLNDRKQDKSINFPIPLKPAEVNPGNKLMGKVLKEIQGLREEVQGLKNEIVGLNKENQQLQRILAMDYYEIICPVFDITDPSAKKFQFSNDKRTISLIDNQGSFLLCSETALPKEKNSKFRVKIESGPGMMSDRVVGVAVKSFMKNNSLSAGTYCIVLPNFICLNGSKNRFTHDNGPPLPEGSIVGVQYIPSRSEIRFDINGEHVFMTVVDVAYQKLDIFPFVLAQTKNIRLSFI